MLHTSQHETQEEKKHILPSQDVGTTHEAPVTPENKPDLFTPEQVQELIDEALELGAKKLDSLFSHGVWGNKILPRYLDDFAQRIRANKGKWLKEHSSR